MSICVRFDPNGDLRIGNINYMTLEECWNSPKRKEYIDYHIRQKRNELPGCSKCHYWGVPRGIESGITDGLYIQKFMQDRILKEPLVSSIDYAGVYDPETMVDVPVIKGDILLAVALKVGNTRLIDNMLVTMVK